MKNVEPVMVVAQKQELHHRRVTTVPGRDRCYRALVFFVFKQHARLVGAQAKQFVINAQIAEDTGSPRSL
jgi:hypothetical protein